MQAIDPPGIIRQHVDSVTLARLAVDINEAIVECEQMERRTYQNYLLIGDRLAEAKSGMQHGQWGKWIKENIRCSDRHERRYRAFAEQGRNLNAEQLVELWQKINGNEEEPKSDVDDRNERLGPPKSDPPKPAAQQGSPYPVDKRCRDCRFVGGPGKPHCHACDEKNRPTEPQREPGDEPTKTKKKSSNGEVVIDWKDWSKGFGSVVRSVDRVGNVYNVKESEEAEALRDVLGLYEKAFKEWSESLKKKKDVHESELLKFLCEVQAEAQKRFPEMKKE